MKTNKIMKLMNSEQLSIFYWYRYTLLTIILQLNLIHSMGVECACLKDSNQFNAQILKSMETIERNLHVVLRRKDIQCNQQDITAIHSFITGGHHEKNQWSHSRILVLGEKTVNIIKVVEERSKEMLLVVKFGKCEDKMEVQGKISQEGAVVYDKGVYIGDLKDDRANGKGAFYLTTDHGLQGLTVKGQWRNGQIDEVTLQHDKKKITIEMKDESTAKLTFHPDKENIKPLYYQGSIKINCTGNANLSQIMTGSGKIYFPNGDYYTGDVRHGKMHTEKYKQSTYFSSQSGTRYYGGFKNGKRHGKGTIEIETDISGHQKDIYALKVDYIDGVMQEGSRHLQGLISRECWEMSLSF